MVTSIYIELQARNGKRVVAYRIFTPSELDNEDYNAYEDDGQGNGDHLGSTNFSSPNLETIMVNLAEKIVKENL